MKRRFIEMILLVCWSALGIWYAAPTVEYHALQVGDKLTGAPVRLAVVSVLHSCRYGDEQKGLVEMAESGRPDVVFMVGDIFGDRLPEGPTRAFVTEMVKRMAGSGGVRSWASARIPPISTSSRDVRTASTNSPTAHRRSLLSFRRCVDRTQ